jgi:hypothetical protein
LRKKVFILTNNSKFFFKLNKELKRLRIPFTVLNIGQRIPNIDALVLTTLKEVFNINNYNERKVNFVPYKEEENFEKYLFNFLKIYQCGFKEYSKLLFSIDPGETIGMIVFLDGMYFYSKTFFTKEDLLTDIRKCIANIEEESRNEIKLIFKIGRGVSYPFILEFITNIYQIFQKKENIRIYLINELKSSKFKFHKIFKSLSKHEASALILALRKGVKVDRDTYQKFFELKKSDKTLKKQLVQELNEISFLNRNIDLLKSLIIDLLNCKISIDRAFDIINQEQLLKQYPE